mmetsp:Transcript_58408/g.148414  ORF Transcript_58408/g.148414 Transcript_58408/m.148414 type:complete len:810 (+) Transcript_58408:195-2624(+)
MSLRTVVEVALHFESFRNVDLFHQGLYHLKSRIYREDGNRRLLGTPYSNFGCTLQVAEASSKPKPARTDHHHLIPAHIIEDQCTFSTRSFLIRYCEEEVELDDVGQFRIEIGREEADTEMPLTMEVDLMFADLTQHGGADRFGEQPDVDSTEFKSISTQLFRLHRVETGLHEFCPVVFDEFHFCLANIVVHTAVLDFRLRIWPTDQVLVRPKPAGSQQAQGKASSEGSPAASSSPVTAVAVPAIVAAASGGGAGGNGASGGGGAGGGTMSGGAAGSALGQPSSALSLSERVFAGAAEGGPEELLRIAEGVYHRHIGTLAASYARQAEWFNTVCTRCLTEAQREAIGELCRVPELVLPEGMTANPSSSSTASASASSAPRVGGSVRQALVRRIGRDDINERTLAASLAYDLNEVSCQLATLWYKLLNVMSYACRETAAFLRMAWEESIIEQWGASVLRETMNGPLSDPEDKCIGDAHDQAAERLRRTAKAKVPESVEDLMLLPSMEERPILFEQRYLPKSAAPQASGYSQLPLLLDGRIPSAPKEYRGVHLFVLVHGFQGNSFDMRLMKNNIALLYPDAIFLCSNSNEDNTEGDFSEMGIRLAQEVVNYICDWCPGSALGRLSFIAHSIGGLIVRSALPLLHEYSSKMFTLLTFSTPHVGYFLKNITLFHMGLRVLQSWRQSTCLAQLSMADNDDPRETFLYRLSQTKGFEFFQNVVLISCPSDQYSPFDSARVEIGGMLGKHSHQDVYMSMVRNIWEPVEPQRVFRFDVNFYIPEKNLDTFIGRAAHIQFLECQPIMKMIIHNYSFLFR